MSPTSTAVRSGTCSSTGRAPPSCSSASPRSSAALLSIPLGIWAAVRRGGLVDQATRVFFTLGYALPAFLVGIALILVFGLKLGWAPIGGYGTGVASHLGHLVLPALTLAIPFSTVLVRSLRASTITVLESDFVTIARLKGISEPQILMRHVLRNAISPVAVVFGINLAFLVGGTVVVENVFSIPGLGSLLVGRRLDPRLPGRAGGGAGARGLRGAGQPAHRRRARRARPPPVRRSAAVTVLDPTQLGSRSVAGRARWLAVPLPRAVRGRPALFLGVGLLLVISVLCLGAPLFTSYSPTEIDALAVLVSPGTDGHLLGTDAFGRDLWARLLYGGRYDLAIAFGATSVTLVVGTAIGMASAYAGGWVDAVVMRIVDLFFAFPFIVLVIAIVAALGPSLRNMFIALWIASWVGYARIAHGQTLSASRYGYVVAAGCLGYSRRRILARHVLPSVLPFVIVFAMVDAVGNVLLGASLGFLGIGIPQPTPEWGSMISGGQAYLLSNWQLSLIPGLALVLLGVAFSLLGDGLADLFRAKQ